MGFAQGKYGVQYHPRQRRPEGIRLRRTLLACAVSLALVGAAAALILRSSADDGDDARHDDAVPPPPAVAAPVAADSAPGAAPQAALPPAKKPAAKPAAGTAANSASRRSEGKAVDLPRPDAPKGGNANAPRRRPLPTWLEKAVEDSGSRPVKVRQQLERLAQGLREERLALAIDALERLYDQPTMADLEQHLVSQLGLLNMRRLIAETNTPWTVVQSVRRGDTLERLSRERRTTLAATRRLNPGVDPAHLKIGQKVRLLNYPNAALVIHKKLEYADLFMKNGSRLFKRYCLRVDEKAAPGVYPVSGDGRETAAAIFGRLGVRTSSKSEREELEMFMSSGSRVTVSEQ